MKRLLHAFILIGGLAALAGCASAIDRAVDSAVDRTAQRTGEAVGDAVGERVGQMAAGMVAAHFPASWNAQYMQLYTGYLFNVAFHAGTYSVAEEPYEPGEWTRWRMVEAGEPTEAVIERAFLAETEAGNQWWRVKYSNTETDEDIVLEGLFTADRSELLRLRGQFPGEEAKEMPVQEGTYGYTQPTTLTAQSLEGATVGEEQVQVPAGAFEAQHVRYGTAGSTLEWWLNEDVPGGMVKYLRSADNATSDTDAAPASWVVELADYGEGAESELGVL